MSTGQTFLALGAIILLTMISMNIGQMSFRATDVTVETQVTNDAINFAQDVIEELQSYSKSYDQLEYRFGDLNDVSNEDKRRQYTSQIGRIYYTTVDLSSEMILEHGQMGRMAIVQIYKETESGNGYEPVAEFRTAILPLEN